MGCSMALEEGRKGNFGGIRRMWNATRASWMWHANKVSLNRRTECKYLTLMLVKQCTSCCPLYPALSLSLSLTQLQVEWPFVSSWVTLHTVKRLHSYWFDVALYFCVFSFCLNSILVHCTFCDGRKCDQADDGRWKWLAGGKRGVTYSCSVWREGQADSLPTVAVSKKFCCRWADCQLAARG